MKRELSIAVAAFLAAGTFLTSAANAAESASDIDFTTEYTDKEIEKRIDEIGEACIQFYIDGWNPVYDEVEDGLETGKAYVEVTEETEEAYEPVELFNTAEDLSAVPDGAYEEYVDIGTQIDELHRDLPWNTEEYTKIDEHGFTSVRSQPFSTFGADVDTASYALLRRGLIENAAAEVAERQGMYSWYYHSPVEESAIRIEEMVN